MKPFQFIALLFAAGLLGGCATSQVNTDFAPGLKVDEKEPVAVAVAENYGYYLFGVIPLFAGNPDDANAVSMSLFEDTVTIENNHKMILSEVDKLDTPYMLTDMRDSTDWTGGFSLWIIWKQVLTSNAVAVKATSPADHASTVTFQTGDHK